MFEIKLKDIIPEFGYVTCSKRSKFFSFCSDMRFIEFIGIAVQKKKYAYRILVEFKYSAMGSYRATDVSCNPGEIIIVDSAFRPREKLNGIFGSHITGIQPPILPNEYNSA